MIIFHNLEIFHSIPVFLPLLCRYLQRVHGLFLRPAHGFHQFFYGFPLTLCQARIMSLTARLF